MREVYTLMAEIDRDFELYKRNKAAKRYSRSVWRKRHQRRNHRLAMLVVTVVLLSVFVLGNPLSVWAI